MLPLQALHPQTTPERWGGVVAWFRAAASLAVPSTYLQATLTAPSSSHICLADATQKCPKAPLVATEERQQQQH